MSILTSYGSSSSPFFARILPYLTYRRPGKTATSQDRLLKYPNHSCQTQYLSGEAEPCFQLDPERFLGLPGIQLHPIWVSSLNRISGIFPLNAYAAQRSLTSHLEKNSAKLEIGNRSRCHCAVIYPKSGDRYNDEVSIPRWQDRGATRT